MKRQILFRYSLIVLVFSLSCAAALKAVAQTSSRVRTEAGEPVASLASTTSSIELRWDMLEPVGYMGLLDGDTACVTFPGVAGGRLDSLRVGVRRSGSMTGGIWKYGKAGAPLGKLLVGPFTVSSASDPGTPYPVPWTNWVTVDVGADSLDVDSSFAVAFVCQGDPLDSQRVMVTTTMDSVVHSFSYLHDADSASSPGWFSLPVGTSMDTTYAYLIRAYVTTSSSAVVANANTPREYSLVQNYPNPFNPTTVINGQWTASSWVKLIVYDVLGREVAILADGWFPAGMHTFTFDGRNLASGVYLYRLIAGPFVATKKMLLVR